MPVLLNDSQRYINRELSLLGFQRRVLEEALKERNPLLERVKFLAILGTNLDEFFMIRVSGIRKLIESGDSVLSIDSLTPGEQLNEIRKKAAAIYTEAQKCYLRKIIPELKKAGIHVLDYARLKGSQKENVDKYFREVVFPVLTPLALDPGHPFPHISNLSLNLAIVIRDAKGNEKFSRLKVPHTLPELLPIKRPKGGKSKNEFGPQPQYFIWLEQVIIANLGLLFPGMEVVSTHPFRILRDADIEIQEIEADDLLEAMQQSIRKRKFGSVVQVSINENMPENIRKVLIENLEVGFNDVYPFTGHLGLTSLWQIYSNVERQDLKFPKNKPAIPKPFIRATAPEDFFDIIDKQNVLFHHPYDSFTPVVDFLNASARDPNVLAIKQTLYRIGKNSPVVESLMEAAEHGKQVAVLVELKARFDEESNIGWARMLEEIGVHVVYGVLGLKTHCKIALVVRKDGDGIRRYVHISTGNYNVVTSKIYEDLGIFTSDLAIGEDVTDLFNYLTGYSIKQDFRKLLVAPINLQQKLEAYICREIEHAQRGEKAQLIFKVNSISNKNIIDLLYLASQAGVKVDLLVREICCLRPGVKGLSENIRVISVVGRFLEHSRIYYFHNGGHEVLYLGSADLMTRNLNNRVEVLFPVDDPAHIQYLRDVVLQNYLRETQQAWIMQPDGTYKRNSHASAQELNIQEMLMTRA
jgi:polyphosphate kinase